jgi:hypothetical protein
MAHVPRRRSPRLLVLAAVTLLAALAFAAEASAGGSSFDPDWTQHWTPPSSDRFSGGHLARAATGDLYVGGEIDRGSSSQTDWLVARYTAAGERKWVHAFAGPSGDDTFNAIAADANGNVIGVGNVSTTTHSLDWMVVKWNRAGKRVWKRQLDGSAHGADDANDVVVGTDGSVYVTGVVRRTGTYDDGLTVKYSPGGHVLWSKYYDGAEHSSDNLLAMAIDAKNRVYVTGFDYATGRANDCLLIRYSPSGHRDWLELWGGPAHGHDMGFDVAVRGTSVAVAGMTTVDPVTSAACGLTLKYSTASVFKWKGVYVDDDPTLDAAWNHVGVDGTGRVAVGGYAAVSPAPGDAAWVTTVYSSAGTAAPVLEMQGDPSLGGNYIRDLRMTAAGRTYEVGCLGSSTTSLDLYVIALSPHGAPLWGSIINDPVGANDYAGGVVTTSKAVYVGGTMYQDLVLLKYKPMPVP